MKRFLHPVLGGPAGKGWQVGQNVMLPDIFRAVMPSDQIGFISGLTLAPDKQPPYKDPPIGSGLPFDDNTNRPFHFSAPGTWVQLTDYELVCYSEQSKVNPSDQT